MLLRRFGCTAFAPFLPQWCSGHHFLDAWVGAAVRWGGIALSLRPRGSETHSILPFHILGSRMMSTVCMFIVGTPFYCRLSRRRSKHSGISSTFPFKYQYLQMCMITSQLIHGEASKWILYIYIEVLKHYSVGWFNDWVHFRSHCTSENADFCDLGGQIRLYEGRLVV